MHTEVHWHSTENTLVRLAQWFPIVEEFSYCKVCKERVPHYVSKLQLKEQFCFKIIPGT